MPRSGVESRSLEFESNALPLTYRDSDEDGKVLKSLYKAIAMTYGFDDMRLVSRDVTQSMSRVTIRPLFLAVLTSC